MSVQTLHGVVYRSSRTGRRYLTLRAAIRAEARAIILAKYPSEKPEYENGYTSYPGFYWRDLPNSEKLYRRVVRLVKIAAITKEAA